MKNELERQAERFLSGEEGRRIAGKKADIQRIAASGDGERVKAMLDRAGFEDALRRGDAAEARRALSQVMETDSGKALVSRLQGLLGGK